MNAKRMIASIFALSVFFLTFFVALPNASASTIKLGGMDIDGYCKQRYNITTSDATATYIQTGSAKLLDQNNPYAWRCHVTLISSLKNFPWTSSTQTSDLGIDLTDACRKQYANNNAFAVLEPPANSPYLWACYQNVNDPPTTKPPTTKPPVANINGKVIVINPGHGLIDGRSNDALNPPMPAYNGICDTTYHIIPIDNKWKYTGTCYPDPVTNKVLIESTLTIDISKRLAEKISAAGGIVKPTRNLDDTPNVPDSRFGASEYLKGIGVSADVWDYTGTPSGFVDSDGNNLVARDDVNARPRYANSIGANALVSIHVNNVDLKRGDPCQQGTWIFADGNNNYAHVSQDLANRIKEKMDQMRSNAGYPQWNTNVKVSTDVKAENYYFNGPAVIVEVGFICDPTDIKAIQDPNFQNFITSAISDSLVNYPFSVSPDAATFLDQSTYPTVQVGQGFQIYFTVKNTSNAIWMPRQYWLQNTGLPLGAPSKIDITRSVVPGDTYTWSMNLTAPLGAGVYRTGWMISGPSGNLFGPNMYIDVTVKPDTSNPNVIVIEQPSLGDKDYTGNQNVCDTGWYKLYDEIDKRYFIYTLTASQIGESKNRGTWTPNIPRSARVKVEILQPQHHAYINWPCWTTSGWDTQVAVYQIHHRDGDSFVTVNQQNSAGWIDIGTYNFAQGAGNYVKLPDLTGEGLGSRYVVFGAVRFTVLDTPATTPTNTPMRTSTAPAPMPDLSIASAKIELANGNGCQYSSKQLGVSVVVKNIGNASAGSFALDVNGIQQTVSTGLGIGQQTTLWFSGYQPVGNVIKVDVSNQVAESNETNNNQTIVLSIPTLPAPCTPSLTPTGSLPAATITRTSTIMPSQTPTSLPVITSTPTRTLIPGITSTSSVTRTKTLTTAITSTPLPTPAKTLTTVITSTPSSTLTKTLTPGVTFTPSSTPTKTLTTVITSLLSPTPTKSPTPIITATTRPTLTKTPRPAFTSTPTLTPTITLVPVPTGGWTGINYMCGGQYYAERVRMDWDAITHNFVITKIDGDACIGAGVKSVEGNYYNSNNTFPFSLPTPVKLWIKDTNGLMTTVDRTGVMVSPNKLEIRGGSYVIVFTSGEPVIANAAISPAYDGSCNGWYKFGGAGYGGTDLYVTLNTNVPSGSPNSAKWTPNLPRAGQYRVDAYMAYHPQITWPCSPYMSIGADTSNAQYQVYPNGSLLQTVPIDQLPLNDQWATIGTYSFSAGASSYVTLADLNNEASLTRLISFNVLRFVYVGP